MYKTVLNFFDTGYKFNGTGGTEQMSNHRFGGIDLHIICVTAKSKFDRTRLKQVVVMRGCSMCIDVGMIIDRVEMKDMAATDDIPVLDLSKLDIAPEHHAAIEKAVKELERQGLSIKVIK